MKQYGKWLPLRELGTGGQGTVHLARDTTKADIDTITSNITKLLQRYSLTETTQDSIPKTKKLLKFIHSYIRLDDEQNLAALKVLHKGESLKELDRQLQRMKREVNALNKVSHPNIVSILDEQLEEGWFTMQYFPNGTLAQRPESYRGNMLAALTAFRPLVDAVSKLHREGWVHRDIKPDNIFVAGDGRLILGDLGLIYFTDDTKTRVSDTFENVGSSAWMPAWAMGMRLEDIRPSFDVFSLGKVLWSMLSGQRILRLWYHHRKQFELENMFPHDPAIRWARKILDPCIVEEENHCLGSASGLLELIDSCLPAIRADRQVFEKGVGRQCQVCNVGTYQLTADKDLRSIENFGLKPTGKNNFKIYSCDNCGHVDLFHIRNSENDPPGWK